MVLFIALRVLKYAVCLCRGCDIYSAGSGVNRVQVVLSGFSKRLFCFVQAKTLCRYGCMYFLAALVLVCVGCRLHKP